MLSLATAMPRTLAVSGLTTENTAAVSAGTYFCPRGWNVNPKQLQTSTNNSINPH